MTAGEVMREVIARAEARGCASVTYAFTDDGDSDGEPWSVELPPPGATD